MDNVSFGSYVFPTNPREILVKSGRRTSVQSIALEGERVHQALPKLTEVTMRGELFSPTAQRTMALYTELLGCYERGDARLLCIPGHRPFYAYFTALELTAKGDGCTLEYRAAFCERECTR